MVYLPCLIIKVMKSTHGLKSVKVSEVMPEKNIFKSPGVSPMDVKIRLNSSGERSPSPSASKSL